MAACRFCLTWQEWGADQTRLKQTRSISRPWNGRMSILLDNRQPTCPEGYSLPRTPRKKFDPTIYYGPRATPEPGKPWWYLVFLGIQFPLYPRNRCITEPFCPCFAPESVCFRACLSPTCTGIGKTCHRVATGMVYHRTMSCPCPCHGNGTACNPLNPRNQR